MINFCIEANRVAYQLNLSDKFSVISGPSGIGKSVLLSYIIASKNNLPNINVDSKMDYELLDSLLWENFISTTNNTLFFVDGQNNWIASKEFADLALASTNYFVLFTRDILPYIPYFLISYYSFQIERKQHYLIPYEDYTTKLKKQVNCRR